MYHERSLPYFCSTVKRSNGKKYPTNVCRFLTQLGDADPRVSAAQADGLELRNNGRCLWWERHLGI